MKKDALMAVAIFFFTLGVLHLYNSPRRELSESEKAAVVRELQDEYRAVLRDKLERFRTGRLTEEEKKEVAAAQERFAQAFESSMREIGKQLEQTDLFEWPQ